MADLPHPFKAEAGIEFQGVPVRKEVDAAALSRPVGRYPGHQEMDRPRPRCSGARMMVPSWI